MCWFSLVTLASLSLLCIMLGWALGMGVLDCAEHCRTGTLGAVEVTVCVEHCRTGIWGAGEVVPSIATQVRTRDIL